MLAGPVSETLPVVCGKTDSIKRVSWSLPSAEMADRDVNRDL
jgi:hypothetical protein